MSLVWGLMAEHAAEGGFEYDAVVLARPDVWFHYDVNIARYSSSQTAHFRRKAPSKVD